MSNINEANNSSSSRRPEQKLERHQRVSLRKQNAISVTVTSSDTQQTETTLLNEITTTKYGQVSGPSQCSISPELCLPQNSIVDRSRHDASSSSLVTSTTNSNIDSSMTPTRETPIDSNNVCSTTRDPLSPPKSQLQETEDISNQPARLGANYRIPNVYFTKLQTIDDQEHSDSSQNQLPVRLNDSVSRNSQPNQVYHDEVISSDYRRLQTTASPRIERRIQAGCDIVSTSGNRLGAPIESMSRKLSLQPISSLTSNQSKSLLNDVLNGQQQQQYQAASSLNLTVAHPQLLTARKSIIGKLERSSFQAQRLSDVGVAFGQQITARIGLKIPASQERIVEQTRCLYLRYIFIKLRQNKLPLRDLNLTKISRARRAAAMGASPTINVSHSAPVSSTDIVPNLSDQFNRKRNTLALNDINAQDLSLFAARMSTFKKVDEKSDGSPGIEGTGNAIARKHVMDPAINKQIFSVIVSIIRELRDMKPDFYSDTLYEIIGIDKFSSIDSLLEVQMTICREMTRSEISWCRIVALFSLFGAISLDCVRLGAPEHVGPLLDGFIEFVERDLAFWISQQGGWESFLYKFKSSYSFGIPMYQVLIVVVPILTWALVRTFD